MSKPSQSSIFFAPRLLRLSTTTACTVIWRPSWFRQQRTNPNSKMWFIGATKDPTLQGMIFRQKILKPLTITSLHMSCGRVQYPPFCPDKKVIHMLAYVMRTGSISTLLPIQESLSHDATSQKLDTREQPLVWVNRFGPMFWVRHLACNSRFPLCTLL